MSSAIQTVFVTRLGTLGTGTDAQAIRINERGQVIGDSYTNSNPSEYCSNSGYALTTGAFIWQNGEMENLGSFGGTCTLAPDLNNSGQVVGASTVAGDSYQRAFRWENGSLRDLGGSIGGKNTRAIATKPALPSALHPLRAKPLFMRRCGDMSGS